MLILLANSGGGEVDSVTAITLAIFLWLIVKALMAPFTRRALPSGSLLTEEDRAMLSSLQSTLADMEQRIESLETILVETHHTSPKYQMKF